MQFRKKFWVQKDIHYLSCILKYIEISEKQNRGFMRKKRLGTYGLEQFSLLQFQNIRQTFMAWADRYVNILCNFPYSDSSIRSFHRLLTWLELQDAHHRHLLAFYKTFVPFMNTFLRKVVSLNALVNNLNALKHFTP